jgi:hypothetical protein
VAQKKAERDDVHACRADWFDLAPPFIELDGQLNTLCESEEGLRVDCFRLKTANTSIGSLCRAHKNRGSIRESPSFSGIRARQQKE